MTRLIHWWMSKPTTFEIALTAVSLPYIFMLVLFWLVKH